MFAGRYAWWMLTGVTLILAAVFALETLSIGMAALFGCGASENACSGIAGGIVTTLKPLMAWIGWGMIAGSLLVRLAWLGFSPLWIPPVLVWSLALGGALRSYLPLWHGRVDLALLIGIVPPAGFALLAIAVFLGLPFEDEAEGEARSEPAPIGVLAGVAAGLLTLQVLVGATGLPVLLVRFFHMPMAANMLARAQRGAASLLHLDSAHEMPGLIMAGLFALALALRILRREIPLVVEAPTQSGPRSSRATGSSKLPSAS